MKIFKRYFLKALAFFLVFYLLKFLFPTAFGFINVNAKPVDNVSGSYGFIRCTNDAVNGLANCSYVQSYGIIGENTTYTMLDKATTFVHNHTNYARLNVFSSLFLFPNLNYKNGSFYTLNFKYDQGGYVTTIIDTLTKANLVVESFNGTDYVSGGFTDLNFSADKNGHISITFKATTDTTSYRIRIQPGVAIWTNPSTKYDQGVRVFLISANVEDNLSDALLSQITNQNETIINQNQQIIDNSKKATEEQKKTNDLLESTDTTGANSSGNDFFNNFDSGSNGDLTSLVNLPLNYINHLNDKCEPFTLPLGKFGNISIPCLSSIWSTTGFSSIINIISVIINGLICYKVGLNLLLFFNNLRDPESDKLEVMDL